MVMNIVMPMYSKIYNTVNNNNNYIQYRHKEPKRGICWNRPRSDASTGMNKD